VKAIRWVLERTPPELAADIMKSGIHLTGDGARLFALDRYISESLGIPVLLAREPGDCCILGIGYLTENIQLVTPQDKRSRPSMK
jgi:rod shape-determining protein MreB